MSNYKYPEQLHPYSYSLSAFWPGIQFLLGDYVNGKATMMRFLYAWDFFGYIPEMFDIISQTVVKGGEEYVYGVYFILVILYAQK